MHKRYPYKNLFLAVVLLGILAASLFPQPALAGCPGPLGFGGKFNPLNGACSAVKGAAGDIGGAIGKAFLNFFEMLLKAINWLAGRLLEIAGRFLTFILIDFNQKAGFYDNPFVQEGWRIVRDVANWFFIVFLIVIAFSTILGIEGYGARRLLPKLIIVALLINFSLFLTGVVVNVSQLFMVFFVNSLTCEGCDDIGQALANQGFGYPELKGAIAPATDAIAADFMEVMSLILSIGFQLVAAGILFYLAIMLIIRVAFLWMQMILSPLAFASVILPATSHFFGQWLHRFVNYSIFGIFAVFFIWLSTHLIAYLGDLSRQENWDTMQLLVGEGGSALFLNYMVYFLKYVTVALFLLMGYKIAKELSGEIAGITSKIIATGVTGALLVGGVGAAGVAGAAALGRIRAMRGMAESKGVRGAAERVGGVLTQTPLRRLPLAARTGQVLTEFGQGVPMRRAAEEKGKGITEANILARLVSATPEMAQEDKMALVNRAIDLKRVYRIPSWLFNEVRTMAKQTNNQELQQKIERAAPPSELAQELTGIPAEDHARRQEAIARHRQRLDASAARTRPADFEIMSRYILRDATQEEIPNVNERTAINEASAAYRKALIRSGYPEHLKKIAQLGETRIVEAFEQTIASMPDNEIPARTRRYLGTQFTQDIWETRFARGEGPSGGTPAPGTPGEGPRGPRIATPGSPEFQAEEERLRRTHEEGGTIT